MNIIISESQYKVIEEFETRPQVFYSFARMPNRNWVTDDNKIYSEEFFDDKDFDEYQFDNFFDMDQMFGHKNSLFGTRGLEVGLIWTKCLDIKILYLEQGVWKLETQREPQGLSICIILK